ncbi:MAG: ABC transporter substrate-binding protein [Betaproteobacteria bacterium]|nr:ABC transporter substrate-binding protein [Betaproteobacteria bacterium]
MARGATIARSFLHLSHGLPALLPLPGSAYRHRRPDRSVAPGIFFEVLSGPTHAQAPIRIGTSLGLAGFRSESGQTIPRGYQRRVKETNAKGGVLGRKLELTILDDQLQIPAAVANHERLLTQDKSDLAISPYSSPITDAAAAVTEKRGKPKAASEVATTSLFKKGRRFLFMLLSPAEIYPLVNRSAKP